MKNYIKISAATNTGRVRQNNEDSFWFKQNLQAMAIADGIGGLESGERASRLAVEYFDLLCHKFLLWEMDSMQLSDHISNLIFNIKRCFVEIPDKTVIGTTLLGAIYKTGKLHIIHVGDSRAAFVSAVNGSVTWLTKDDTEAELLVRKGEITRKEALVSELRHHLTAYLSNDPGEIISNVHYQSMEWEKEDILLLCTDGLYTDVSDDEIGELLLADQADLATVAQSLTTRANDNGGHDNCTVILARIC